MFSIDSEILNCKEAASYLKLKSHKTLYKWVKEGRIKCFKAGDLIRFTKQQLDDFLILSQD